MAKAVITEYGTERAQMTVWPTRAEAKGWAVYKLASCKLGSTATIHEGAQLTDTIRVELLAGRPHIVGRSIWPTMGPTQLLTKHLGIREEQEARRALAERGG